MKVTLLALVCSLSLVWGQNHPGGHTPDYTNPSYMLDNNEAVIAIKTSSGCYLYYLTPEQLISAGDPGGLDSMEHVLLKSLKHTNSFPVVGSSEYHRLSSEIHQACKAHDTYDIHEVRH